MAILNLKTGDYLGRRKKKNTNGNGSINGNENNGQTYKIGTCPYCGRENIQITEHHIYKRAVYGENERIALACRDCHNVIEFLNRMWENMVLRPFIGCYKDVFKAFEKGEINGFEIRLDGKMDEKEVIRALMPIVLKGFKKIENKGINPWLEERIEKKGISVRAKKKKENNNEQ